MDSGIYNLADFSQIATAKFDILVALGIAGGAVSSYFGGWDTALITLIAVMAIDWISGMMVALVFKRSGKTLTGGLRSDVGFIGLCKKAMVLLIVLVATQLDTTTGTTFIRDVVIVAYTVNEIVSILENAGMMGVPIPKVLKNAIEVLKEQTGNADMEDDADDNSDSI